MPETNYSLSKPVDVYICVTCRTAQTGECDERPGLLLKNGMENALQNGHCDAPVRLHGVECLSVCTRACTLVVSSPGKWSYIIGNLDAHAHIGALCDYLRSYAASPHGTPPLKERPAAIRAGTIARIPPLTA